MRYEQASEYERNGAFFGVVGRRDDITGDATHFPDQFVAAFLAALFSLLVLVLIEYIKRRWDVRNLVRKEHAYLERYFGQVSDSLEYDIGLLPMIISGYQDHKINAMPLVPVPMREDASMRMDDRVFINRVDAYMSELRMLNLSIDNMNRHRDRINADLTGVKVERGEQMKDSLVIQAEQFKNVLAYHQERLLELVAENRVILRSHKNWNGDWESFSKDVQSRKAAIQQEVDLLTKERKTHPIRNERLEKLKKYGLFDSHEENV